MKIVYLIFFLPSWSIGQTYVISYQDLDSGEPTQSGEIYDLDALTAASNLHHLGSWIRLYSKNEKKSVILRVNDCSNELGDTLKISRSAAEILELKEDETNMFKVEVIKIGNQRNPCKKEFFGVQLASFSNFENAHLLLESLQQKGLKNILIIFNSNTYKVVGGRFSQRIDSEEYRDYLKKEFNISGFITILE
ncbi:MAG: hypothetical protein RJA52_861 [Bacteroidota bacterium]|jgi:rare lipoprotein A